MVTDLRIYACCVSMTTEQMAISMGSEGHMDPAWDQSISSSLPT